MSMTANSPPGLMKATCVPKGLRQASTIMPSAW